MSELDRRALIEQAMDEALEQPKENVIEQEPVETEATSHDRQFRRATDSIRRAGIDGR